MSYTYLLYHIVFRTYASEPVLPVDAHIETLYRSIVSITKRLGGVVVRINSMPEHVHLLCALPPKISLSDFMQNIKGGSSKLIKPYEGFERFSSWGKGYAALTKSLEDKEKIIRYIKNQQEHHKSVSFRTEYEQAIKDMGLIFDDRDWYR